MEQTMPVTEVLRLPPNTNLVARDRAATLECGVRMFLELSAALELSRDEERTLLNLSSREMVRLRLAPCSALQLGGGKLERRVDYAIPILQRMVAALAS